MRARRGELATFSAMALGLLVVGVAGYVGFVGFVGSDRGVAAGVMVLAAGTGFAAFFSPCSFPLLLSFLARRSARSLSSALTGALRVAAGAALLLTAMAAAISVGGSTVARVVEFDSPIGRVFRLGVGLALVFFGLDRARLVAVRMRWLDRIAGISARRFDPSRVINPVRSDVTYGFGYLLAGFG